MTDFKLPDHHVLCRYCGHEAGAHREVGQCEWNPTAEGPCVLSQREVVELND